MWRRLKRLKTYKNQYENSINKISQYTDESGCPMSCEDKLSNLDYCYNNDASIKAELETTFVDYLKTRGCHRKPSNVTIKIS